MIDLKRYEGHTKGRWMTNYTGYIWGDCDNSQLDGDTPLIAAIFKGDCEPQKSAPLSENQKADAALIADAPLLLEEVKRLEQSNKNYSETMAALILEKAAELENAERISKTVKLLKKANKIL